MKKTRTMSVFKRIILTVIVSALLCGMFPSNVFAATIKADELGKDVGYTNSADVMVNGYLCQYVYFRNAYYNPEFCNYPDTEYGGGAKDGNYDGIGGFYVIVNGVKKPAYCIEPGAPADGHWVYTGSSGVESEDPYWSWLRDNHKNLTNSISLAIGYTGQYANNSDYKAARSACQIIIWELIANFRDADTRKVTDTYLRDATAGVNYVKYYDLISNQLINHDVRPSFVSLRTSAAPTITMGYDVSSKSWSATATTSTGSTDMIDYSYLENVGIDANCLSDSKVTFTTKTKITSTKTVKVYKELPESLYADDMYIWTTYDGGERGQCIVSGTDNDPIPMYMKFDTEDVGVLKIKKTSEDGKISGLSFRVSDGTNSYTVTTDSSGVAEITLPLGTYTVTEVNIPSHYETPKSVTATVKADTTVTVDIENTIKKGDMTVKKTSEDGFVSGVKFHLYGTSVSGSNVDLYATTNSSGVATFEDVLIGTGYTLEEVNTPNRYVVPSSQTAVIEWNKVTKKSFNNVLKKWKVTVSKADSEIYEREDEYIGAAQGNASLAGAVYGVYKAGELVDKYTTDENGCFTTKYYVCGDDWTLREITPSEGYDLDETTYSLGFEAGNYTIENNDETLNVYEEIIKGNIAIIKHTDDGSTQIETPEVGAKFEIFLKSAESYEGAEETERDIIVCDENGFGQTKDLPYGVYTVHQVSGWDGRELMPDFDVVISQSQTYRYLINNNAFESYIKVVKKDSETGNTIPYAGAAFKIYTADDELVTMTFTYPTLTTIDTFYTDASGSLITPEELPYGTGYYLVEAEAPYGYVLDETPVYFDVTENNATFENGITVILVDKLNVPQKGTVTVTKTGEVFYDVSVTEKTVDEEPNDSIETETEEILENNNIIYQPVYSVTGLCGAVYEIKAAEDIITPDGTLRYAKDEVVDTITTGEDGTVTSKELYLGKYVVYEVTAPYGYVKSDEVHEIEFTYAGQEVSVIEEATSFCNERQKATLSIQKILETNDIFEIGNNDEIKNVVFGLYAAEELVSAGGATIPALGLIEEITFDENGLATIKTDIPLGSYYVKEIDTDKHYILNSNKYEFVFEYQGQEIVCVALLVNNGEAIENQIIYGSVSGIKKTDLDETLDGAVIGLFKSTETKFTEETALMTTTSGENGSFTFENVAYGTWVVREIQQPKGFLLNETAFEVVIEENGQIFETEIVNEHIRGNISVVKVAEEDTNKKLSGAVFEVYEDVNANGFIDENETMIGTLTETETGIYTLSDVLYGNYLVIETTAPKGYHADNNAYPVFVEEDGVTYFVENTEGVGFVNEIIKGSLKIEKVSTDGIKSGFEFHITGPYGYEITTKTDENGEIVLENLVPGEYVIEENVDTDVYYEAENQTVLVTGDTTSTAAIKNINRRKVTVRYFDKYTNEVIHGEYSYFDKHDAEYDVTEQILQNIDFNDINYYLFPDLTAGDDVSGTLDCDKIINLYYGYSHNVTVEYRDEETGEIIKTTIEYIPYGEHSTEYSVEKDSTIDIPGYTRTKVTGDDIAGKLDEDKLIVVWYKKNPAPETGDNTMFFILGAAALAISSAAVLVFKKSKGAKKQ